MEIMSAKIIVCEADLITKQEIFSQFDKPITEAAKELMISPNQLRKRCRDLGIKAWPYLKFKSIKKIINEIETLIRLKNELQYDYQKITELENNLIIYKTKLEQLFRNPNLKINQLISDSDKFYNECHLKRERSDTCNTTCSKRIKITN